ncbi:phosphatidylserine decarboxylase-like protein [Ceratobasidium sp. AG-I]|nr:phosphatidylserine decarboxylase-like protein [Ceratobasidium sp. AG-I]
MVTSSFAIRRIWDSWTAKLVQEVHIRDQPAEDLSPVIQEFKTLIESDAAIWLGFHQMFDQIPQYSPYNHDPVKKPQIRDYMTMLRAFDVIIEQPPTYERNHMVGFPINTILNWPMGTEGGLAIFLNPKVNAQFKAMFDVWARLLTSPTSCSVLTTEPGGWFSPEAMQDMNGFVDTFICDASALHYGFRSWDDFFTRRFRPAARPIELPNESLVINNACESTVYNIAHNVKVLDRFWLKGQPYSLNHMLDNDPLTPQFAGGTVYQAFLGALDYHRWHSPVDGTILKIVKIPGTYYSQSPLMGFNGPNGPDHSASSGSQAFITAVATRSLVFIQANNPLISLMCFMAVGMAEVSTCEATVKAGDVVKKGDQLGMFHFGGSTHCLIFRPQTKLIFDPRYPIGTLVPLGSALAAVVP